MKIFLIIITVIVVYLVIVFFFNPPDKTDKSWWKRSGMSIYTDHETGIQYLSAGGLFSSSITPRLDKYGDVKIKRHQQ